MKKIGILGAGGFAREVTLLLADCGIADRIEAYYETRDIWRKRDIRGIPVLPIDEFDFAHNELIIAIGDPTARRALRSTLPPHTRFPTIIHPSVLRSDLIAIDQGCVICAGSILTCDISLGRHVHIDRLTTIGHDCVIGDFVTIAPGAVISGNCQIDAGCYLGARSCIKEKTSIAADTTIGMGAVVVKSINMPGIYVGNPARRRET